MSMLKGLLPGLASGSCKIRFRASLPGVKGKIFGSYTLPKNGDTVVRMNAEGLGWMVGAADAIGADGLNAMMNASVGDAGNDADAPSVQSFVAGARKAIELGSIYLTPHSRLVITTADAAKRRMFFERGRARGSVAMAEIALAGGVGASPPNIDAEPQMTLEQIRNQPIEWIESKEGGASLTTTLFEDVFYQIVELSPGGTVFAQVFDDGSHTVENYDSVAGAKAALETSMRRRFDELPAGFAGLHRAAPLG